MFLIVKTDFWMKRKTWKVFKSLLSRKYGNYRAVERLGISLAAPLTDLSDVIVIYFVSRLRLIAHSIEIYCLIDVYLKPPNLHKFSLSM